MKLYRGTICTLFSLPVLAGFPDAAELVQHHAVLSTAKMPQSECKVTVNSPVTANACLETVKQRHFHECVGFHCISFHLISLACIRLSSTLHVRYRHIPAPSRASYQPARVAAKDAPHHRRTSLLLPINAILLVNTPHSISRRARAHLFKLVVFLSAARGAVDTLIKLDDGFRVDGLEFGLEDAVAGRGGEAVGAAARFGRIVRVVFELGEACFAPVLRVSREDRLERGKEGGKYQLPLPLPFFLVPDGSSPARPDLAK